MFKTVIKRKIEKNELASDGPWIKETLVEKIVYYFFFIPVFFRRKKTVIYNVFINQEGPAF